MEIEFNTYYKSLTPTHRIDEEFIVSKAIEEGIIPCEIRYGIMQGVYRGVVKSSVEDLYYFHFVPATDVFRLIKADDPDKVQYATRLLKDCGLGCSLIKAEEQGAVGGGMDVVSEEVDIDQQEKLMTDRHPAAAMITTPDNPARGRMWHEEDAAPVPYSKSWNAATLMESLNTTLRKSTDNLQRPISQHERTFMLEVMGKTQGEIERGDTYMSPSHKVLFQQWMGKSMRTRVNSLSDWLKK